ncbi:MAG TPA: transferase [Cyanobacteria bacterium UBA8803]|nr:transferase [Cyanobacteria bacterium UBA9273]HBL62542.1 transferase [Cyanobacteria bacterium UBA8803]
MHLPPLPLSSHSHVYVQGDVKIDPTAAISSGVILRADPDSQIIIAPGVCIGSGSIIHAYQGTLEVEAGANLGAGVLIVGKGKIGANACIGALTTIYNASVEPWQVVSAASLLGDKGREIAEFSTAASTPPTTKEAQTSSAAANTADEESFNGQAPINPVMESSSTTDEDSPTEPKTESPTSEVGTSVYGQGSLDRILKTLFPYNQSLNRPSEDG